MAENPPPKRLTIRNKILTKRTTRRVHCGNYLIARRLQLIYSDAYAETVYSVREVADVRPVPVANGPDQSANSAHTAQEQFDKVVQAATAHRPPNVRIFSKAQEYELTTFIRDASDYYNGMSSKDVRILAFVYGVCNQVKLPAGWRDKHEASIAWCQGFVKRNKLILLSMGRPTEKE